MNTIRKMRSLIIVLLIPIITFSQKSIKKSDVEIYTQLTFLSVDSNDISEFENKMNSLSRLAKRTKLKEKYDWLLYKSDSDQYLVVNFSDGIKDILTIEAYRIEFQNQKIGKEFEKIMESIRHLGISIKRNYIKEMILPWSTVEQISVSEFPLAKMVEYQIETDDVDIFDDQVRKLVKILKETKYPYPLEGNRGSLGAYGTMTLVWFYDKRNHFEGKNNILKWMTEHNREIEYQSILIKINELAKSKKVHNLTYKKDLSY